jgi:Ca2+/Na+ antiporter
MNLTPMFASDTTAAAIGFVVACLIVAATIMGLVIGGIAIAMNRKLQKRRKSGLILALSPLVFSAPALALSISIYKAPIIAGFPNVVLIPISALPLVCTVYASVLWQRAPTNPVDGPR